MLKLCLIYMVISQGPDTIWTKTFGGTNIDDSWSVKQDSDGNFIIAGWTLSYGAGIFDGYVIKSDLNGNLLWDTTFGGSYNDVFFDVELTSDGGYIFAGYTQSFGAGGKDFYVVKTDINGNEIWSKTYGGTGDDYGYSIKETQDGYIIAGHSNSFTPYYDVYVVKTDFNGDTIWTKRIGGGLDDYARDVIEVSDGYIIAGWTDSFGSGNSDLYIIKLNLNGDSVWAKYYGGTDYDAGYSIIQNQNGEFLIVGYTSSYGAGYNDLYLVKTDSQGNLIWDKTFGGADNERGWEIIQAPDGGYAIAGNTMSYGAGNYDVYILKVDANGNEIWYKTYGGADNDHAYSIDLTSDSGYIVSGGTKSFGAGNIDVYLLRLSSEGIEEKRNFSRKRDIKIILNPSLNKFSINYISEKEKKIELKLFDFNGRFIKNLWNGKISKGKNYFTFSLKSTGSYIILLKGKNEFKAIKLIYLK